MANIIRIKRSTATSTPTTLQNAELAYSELSDKLFVGVGTGGAGGSATTIMAIGGKGAFADLTSAQTLAGIKTFSSSPVVPTVAPSDNSTNVASTAFVKAQSYLVSADLSSYLTSSIAASTYLTISTASSTYATRASPTFTGIVTIPSGASISGFAPLASPALTGTPTAPTATAGTSTTQIATTAFISTAVSNLVASAPEALNTLNELALALGSDASFSTTIATSLGGKLATGSNLSELTATASTARTNLGLGTISTQAASNVAITGGTIDGVTIDGGSF